MVRKLLLTATLLTTAAAVPAMAQPVTGLYIGYGVGANFEQRERQSPGISVGHDTGGTGVASVGYGFGNGLRLELEGDYRYNRISNPGFISSGGREQKYGGMVNVLFDLDVGSPYVYPYIGGGAGYSWEDRKRSTRLSANAVQLSGGVDSSFAYQAIAGLSFPIPPVVGLSLTAEYRFFAFAEDRTFSTQTVTNGISGGGSRFKVQDDYNHSLMLGLRYAFNVAPPPVAVTPPIIRDSINRTFLVFFDWDRADITDRARQIIAAAAQATTQVQVTRIEVSGNTDTSGTAAYNQRLSERRAQNVAAELVRLGVPRASITTVGNGFRNLLVSTGPGVREPQNRRVEIILR